ncbi:MAG TPA: phytanoyl-CoA dioxygenase family protein, partial [Micropepsaceae bacterium]|nr:phytanoyl-CoA dioxygenase family protein [Micropepsaceae bacterium]
MPKRLTAEQVEQFRRDGFVSPVRMLSPADTAGARRELEAMEAAQGGALRGLARTKFYLRYPWAYRLATHPAILDAVEDLIGPDILLYQNTLWAKNAGEETHVSWHQDNTYFGHVPCEVLSVWLALSQSRPESGSMRFLPGSHRLGQLPVRYEVTEGNMLSSGQVSDFDLSRFEPVATSLEAGEASIHHAFLIHGSPPNKSTDRRLGITFVYHPPSLKQIGTLRTSALLVRGQDR